MRLRLFCVAAALFVFPLLSRGQGFSLEIGTGVPAIHAIVTRPYDSFDLADKGQQGYIDNLNPAFTVSGIWRKNENWEFLGTACLTWMNYSITQFEAFGVDPAGKPRYDLRKGHTISSDTAYSPSFTVQFRYLLAKQDFFTLYTGFGAGLSPQTDYIPLPSWTPFAVRFSGQHIYFFAEACIGPVASLGHCGLGFRF